MHPRSAKGGLTLKQKDNKNMKTNRTFFGVLIGVVAVAFAILLAPVSDDVKVAGIVGYGIVVTLLTLAVMEYGRGGSRRYQLR